jgi:hypothetical protein
MKKSTAAAVGAGAAALVVLGAIAFGLGFKPDSAFTLRKDGGGVCRPTEPDPITAGWQHNVTWAVKNEDCDPQYVALENFKHPIGEGQYDPAEAILKDNPVTGGPVAAGDTLKLKTHVTKFRVWPKPFKYEIWLRATAEVFVLRRDPDIDIWP